MPLISIDELPPNVRERLQAKIDRLGYLGEFFQLTAHQPEALAAFIDYTDATKRALPDDLAEVVALSVATATGNDYERHQHERLSVKLGLGQGWVASVELLATDDADLTPQERAAQRWVLAVLKHHGRDTESELKALVHALGPKAAIGVALCAAAMSHTRRLLTASASNPLCRQYSTTQTSATRPSTRHYDFQNCHPIAAPTDDLQLGFLPSRGYSSTPCWLRRQPFGAQQGRQMRPGRTQ